MVHVSPEVLHQEGQGSRQLMKDVAKGKLSQQLGKRVCQKTKSCPD